MSGPGPRATTTTLIGTSNGPRMGAMAVFTMGTLSYVSESSKSALEAVLRAPILLYSILCHLCHHNI